MWMGRSTAKTGSRVVLETYSRQNVCGVCINNQRESWRRCTSAVYFWLVLLYYTDSFCLLWNKTKQIWAHLFYMGMRHTSTLPHRPPLLLIGVTRHNSFFGNIALAFSNCFSMLVFTFREPENTRSRQFTTFSGFFSLLWKKKKKEKEKTLVSPLLPRVCKCVL